MCYTREGFWKTEKCVSFGGGGAIEFDVVIVEAWQIAYEVEEE